MTLREREGVKQVEEETGEKTYTETQLAMLREQMVVTKETENGTSKFTTLPRPNTDLLEDTGMCLRKAPKIELTPEGYTFEEQEL